MHGSVHVLTFMHHAGGARVLILFVISWRNKISKCLLSKCLLSKCLFGWAKLKLRTILYTLQSTCVTCSIKSILNFAPKSERLNILLLLLWLELCGLYYCQLMALVKQQIIARCSVCKFTCVSLISTRNIVVQSWLKF
jgi:hypothetical protein